VWCDCKPNLPPGTPRPGGVCCNRAHAKERFENYDPEAPSLSDADARLLIANQEGYAYWGKYESYLHLDPAVQRVIIAVRSGDVEMLGDTLHADPAAANPRWVAGFRRPTPIPNGSTPLFCVSEGVFRGTNTQHNAYDVTRMLVATGADIHIEGDIVLESAVSFDVIDAVAALLDSGAAIDGVDGDGVPMAYAMHFGFVGVAELLGRRGAKRDLRFAAGLGELDVVKSWFDADGSLELVPALSPTRMDRNSSSAGNRRSAVSGRARTSSARRCTSPAFTTG
jgi:hypothetical protein